jgi:chondroitin 4-sulfotransferase 11
MISHSFRCLSVHIPKAAGNSVNRAFGIGWQDHKDLARYRAEMPAPIFDAYFKFAIVRNPWDRLLSDYNYQRRKSRPADSKLHLLDERGRRRDFAAWTEAALTETSRYPAACWGGDVSRGINRFSPQLDWISLDGVVAVDFVARFEHLREDFRVISRAVGLPRADLERRNPRFHLHYSRYYDDATRDRVGEYYAADIAAFGYDFEDRKFRLTWPGWMFARKPARRAAAPAVSPTPAGKAALKRAA